MDIEKLIDGALRAQKNAYVPFSKFKVGACLVTKSGKYYYGCNVENSAYGVCNCAERTAIFKAVSEGEKDFEAIAICGGDNSSYTYPCGICRQAMVEFNPDLKVIVFTSKNDYKIHTAKELLPYYFKL